MKTFRLIPAIAVIALSIGCSKEKDDSLQNPEATFTENTFNQNFNWSSSTKGNFVVNIQAPQDLYTEDQPIEIHDAEGIVLTTSEVKGGKASFNLSLPVDHSTLYVYYPNTQSKTELATDGQATTLKIDAVDFSLGLNSSLFIQNKSAARKSSSASANMVVDGDFENANLLSNTFSYTTLRPLGGWYKKSNSSVLASMGGSVVFTSNSQSEDGKLLQAFSIDGDQIFDFAYEYGGNAGFYVLFFNDQKKYIGHTRVTVNNNGQASANFLASPTVKYIQIYGFAGQGEWLDNVSLTQVVENDTDNDGVPDRKDYYPNDPTKAYAQFFPTQGRQILAFEDLWPYNGDNDFNDVVMANFIEFSKDANGNLVDATVKVRLNAMGAGQANGIGLVLMNQDREPLSGNIIASVSSTKSNIGTLNTSVQNGIVVVPNLIEALKPYYTNTGSGPSGDPQEFVFTITFNANAGKQVIVPDFYIFKSNEPGREIHLSGFYATEAADRDYFNTGNDVEGTYKNEQGIPWAIEIIYPYSLYFKHPLEKVDIRQAYPQFSLWAASQGNSYKGWMLYPNNSKVYKK